MATTIELTGYGTTVTVLSGELASLANGSLSGVSGSAGTNPGSAFDNTTTHDLYLDFELITGALGGAPTVNNVLALYMSTSLDGTNYENTMAAGANTPDSGHLVGNFVVQSAVTTSQRLHITRVALIPGKHQFQLLNNSGVALPASGASVVAYPYSMQSQ